MTGNLTGDVTGDVTGNLTGDVTGDVTGNLTGNSTGLHTGDVTGNLTGDVTGNLTGDVTGNLTGDVTGNLTGDVTGNLTGDVTGNLTGDVSGNVTGNARSATTIETTRQIAGQPFNGSQNVVIQSNDLSDITLTNITTNQILTYNGSHWENTNELNGINITGLSTPTEDSDAANKAYVDAHAGNIIAGNGLERTNNTLSVRGVETNGTYSSITANSLQYSSLTVKVFDSSNIAIHSTTTPSSIPSFGGDFSGKINLWLNRNNVPAFIKMDDLCDRIYNVTFQTSLQLFKIVDEDGGINFIDGTRITFFIANTSYSARNQMQIFGYNQSTINSNIILSSKLDDQYNPSTEYLTFPATSGAGRRHSITLQWSAAPEYKWYQVLY